MKGLRPGSSSSRKSPVERYLRLKQGPGNPEDLPLAFERRRRQGECGLQVALGMSTSLEPVPEESPRPGVTAQPPRSHLPVD
ncbi:unnamed protein product [Phytophthora lilii]|uniref:Unnamed protein product n=1 Tax=Phytophthora lilii TaxID=2077276 RepID=A0A9W6TPW1_9STRA|nr:unnamed protein product [Phytophthora lilii]